MSKGGRCVRLTTLPPSCAVVVKYGNFNFLEPSGPLQACNGTALPLPLPLSFTVVLKYTRLYVRISSNTPVLFLTNKLFFSHIFKRIAFSVRVTFIQICISFDFDQ